MTTTSDDTPCHIDHIAKTTAWQHPSKPGLPKGWQQGETEDGRTYHIDYMNKLTSWYVPHPVNGLSLGSNVWVYLSLNLFEFGSFAIFLLKYLNLFGLGVFGAWACLNLVYVWVWVCWGLGSVCAFLFIYVGLFGFYLGVVCVFYCMSWGLSWFGSGSES